MKTKISGRVWKYGDDVNTDVIFPGKYTYSISDPQEMAQHALEDLDPTFVEKVQPGDIIVAGKNWGCGSSREQAVTCLKEIGVGAIVARSFARIFYRNAFNNGLILIESDEAIEKIVEGDEVEIDLTAGIIKNISQGSEFAFPPIPDFMLELVGDGGLIPHILKKQGKG